MAALRQALRVAPRARIFRPTARITPFVQRAYASTNPRRPADPRRKPEQVEQASEDVVNEVGDPNMNGNYPDLNLTSALPVKRSLRDPYADWWDPIERRNYNEPIHEDNDILGVFSTEEYTWTTPAKGAVMMGCFIASVGLLCLVVSRFYPDLPATKRTFPGGLEKELGGPNAVRARMYEDEESVL